MTALHELAPTAPTAALLAEVQGGVLVRSFLIAVVVIAPVWFLVRKRVLGDRTPQPAPPEESVEATGPGLEQVIASIADVAATARAGGSTTLTVPHGVTIDGQPADPGTVDALVRDSLRRSGLVAVAEIDSPAGRTLELRELGTGSQTD